MKSHELIGKLFEFDGESEIGVVVGELDKDGMATISWDFEIIKVEGQKRSLVLVPLRYAHRRFIAEGNDDATRNQGPGVQPADGRAV